ncbi:DEAD/DEAH box helicase [Paenibacillus chitinolyticus]|uniref:DEAD/DEAH box helicase n=2 Tax=Paenibacillus chitinolyticus TaxID=79263 RepID=UPI0026A29762
MKVQVYAAADDSGWQWHISLALAVDFTYWFERLGRSVRIVLLEPLVSVGQALALIDVLSSPSCKQRFPHVFPEMQPSVYTPPSSREDPDWLKTDFLITRSYSTGKRSTPETNSDFFNPPNAIHSTPFSSESLNDYLQAETLTSSNAALNHSPPPDGRKSTLPPEELMRTSPPIPSEILQSLTSRSIDYDNWLACGPSAFRDNSTTYDRLIEALNGRSLLSEEVIRLLEASGKAELLENGVWKAYIQLAYLNGDITLTNGLQSNQMRKFPAFWRRLTTHSCRRCGSGKLHFTPCYHCGTDCPYCEECLTMGRVRSCTLLIEGAKGSCEGEEDVYRWPGYVKENPRGNRCPKNSTRESENGPTLEAYLHPWGLSPAQTEASKEALTFLSSTSPGSKDAAGKVGLPRSDGGSSGIAHSGKTAPSFLIWAVTGAGKTEMIFPLLQYELAHGRKIAIATPRRDVVLELQPRLMRAFEGRSIVTLYGGGSQTWESGDITIATTHQLMRFAHAFDAVIIDEIDAFPYLNSAALEFAARKALAPGGRYVLLSATPPRALQREAASGRLPHVTVPVRFHRHPLPVPKRVPAPPLRRILRSGALPQTLRARLEGSLERGAQLFVFVPEIKLVEPLVGLLQGLWPDKVIAGTSSKDRERSVKVTDFRGKVTDILVTTTILERGVTVPKTDVFILDADSSLFNEAALVQMAGRAGRSKDDPRGLVFFAGLENTVSQKGAIRQIKKMNRTARKRGYLLD